MRAWTRQRREVRGAGNVVWRFSVAPVAVAPVAVAPVAGVFGFATVLSMFVPPAEGEELVVRAAERPVAARLSGWDEGPRFAFPENGARAPGEDFVRWGAGVATRPAGWVLLVDGSRLAATVREVGPSEIGIRSASLDIRALPAELVVGWIEHPPRTGLDRLEGEMRSLSGADDVLITAAGERRSGVLQPTAEGEAGDRWAVERRGRVERHPRSRTRAVVLSPVLRERLSREARWQLGLADGSRLAASAVAPEGRVTLASGIAVSLGDGWTGRVRFVAPGNTPEWLLSSAPPLRAVHQPWFPDAVPANPAIARDAARDGGRLRVGGRTYPFGVAMRAGAQAIYRVPAGARALVAELALRDAPVDEAQGAGGAAIFRVLAGADATSIRELFRSGVVRRGEVPVPVAVELEGMRVVVLAVDYGPAGDAGDEAVWLDARWSSAASR